MKKFLLTCLLVSLLPRTIPPSPIKVELVNDYNFLMMIPKVEPAGIDYSLVVKGTNLGCTP
jgi:hypothetical protein